MTANRYPPAAARAGTTGLWLALALSSAASAHIPDAATPATGALIAGFEHPLSGLDHIVAMIAVGLWGGQLGKPAVWVLPVTFPLIMAFGGLASLLGIPLPGVEIGIALSALLLGAMVLLAVRPPLPVAAVCVGLFGLYHGYAHGSELPAGQDEALYSLGFVAATGMLHGVGIVLGVGQRWRWGRLLLRTLGGIIALFGMYFLTGIAR